MKPCPRIFAARIILCAMSLGGTSCDLADTAREAITEDHQLRARGKVGVMRALLTKERAIAVAQSTAAASACALPPAPWSAQVNMKGRVQQGESAAHFQETRLITATQGGDVDIRYEVTWRDAAGRGETWTRQERAVDRALYIKEQNLPYVRHTLRPGAVMEHLSKALDGVATGLTLGGDRWLRAADTWTLGPPGGHSFQRCLPPGQEGWLERLTVAGTLREATAKIGPARRTFRGTIVLHNGQTLTLTIEEEFQEAHVVIGLPQHVSDVRRARPYRDIETILGDKLGLADWKK